MTPEYDPWDDIELSPQQTVDIHKNKSTDHADPWDAVDFDEGFWKNAFRTVLQIPQGFAEATPAGLGAGLFQMLALGESDLGIEEWHKLRELAEEEGIPFNEQAYESARNEMLGMIPTVSNIARGIEEKTGIPLEPKTKLQKGVRLGSFATKLAPQPGTFRGMETGLPAPVLGTGVAVTNHIAKELGVPEPVADIASFAILKKLPEGAPKIDVGFGKQTKPSGLPVRRFEGLSETREVSEKNLSKISDKLESDFKEISSKIIEDSPVGETAKNLSEDPIYKQQSRELLDEAQLIADRIPGTIPTKTLKKEIADIAGKNTEGYFLDEYDKSYLKFTKENLDNIITENTTHGELVKRYRKNNKDLSEYFEPGASKALNRAKRDAILDHNRAIANVLEKSDPELAKVFKEGNARWTKIMDAEAIDSFIEEIFSEKVNYKKMHDFFDKSGYDRIFTRALGEDGVKNFEQLLKDMLESETPYKMLKVAKSKGFNDLFTTAGSYILHPTLGKAKLGLTVAKRSWKAIMNSLLDKPKMALTWKRGVDNLKKGNFEAAQKEFELLDKEVLPKESAQTIREPETIDVTPEKVNAESPKKQIEFKDPESKIEEPKLKTFETEKGSTYEINEDGTTTRNKAERREHGPNEKGMQPKSDKTWYVTKEDADKLSVFQTQGDTGNKSIKQYGDKILIQYTSGPNKNKGIKGTDVSFKLEPEEGLIPIESWEDGHKIHFGNKIKSVKKSPKQVKSLEQRKKEVLDKEIEKHTKRLKNAEKEIKHARDILEKDPKNKLALIHIRQANNLKESTQRRIKELGEFGEELIQPKEYEARSARQKEKFKTEIPENKIDISRNKLKKLNQDKKVIFSEEKTDLRNQIYELEKEKHKSESKPREPEVTKSASKRKNQEEKPKQSFDPDWRYTKEDFPTKKEAQEYLDHLHSTLKRAKESSKPSLERDIKNLEELLEEYETGKPKPISDEKIKEVKQQDISAKGLKDQKKFFIDKLKSALDRPTKTEFIDIEIPGDGAFKVKNNPEAIKKALQRVKSKWPTQPLKKKLH